MSNEPEKKTPWELFLIIGAGILGFVLYVFFGVKPKDPPSNVVVKDEKTVITPQGQEVKVAPGEKAKDVVGAQTVESMTVANKEIKVEVKTPDPTLVPPTEEKSAGELLFGKKE